MFKGIENWVTTRPSTILKELKEKKCSKCKQMKSAKDFRVYETACKTCRYQQDKDAAARRKANLNPDFFDPNTPAF